MGKDIAHSAQEADTHREAARPVLTGLMLGCVAALVGMAIVWAFATDPLIPRRLTCAVKSADGCMVWVDKHRADRFKNARAGT